MSLSQKLLLGIVIRLIMLYVGEVIDEMDEIPIMYTDIDYAVFSDAGALLWEGRSPYERESFRYSPLLAAVTIPNIWIPSFAKHVFVLFDVTIIYLIHRILHLQHPNMRKSDGYGWIIFLWAINPFSANIASRGSADSISNACILLVINFVLSRQPLMAGLVFGFLVHFRVYPIVLLPAFVLHILLQPSTVWENGKNSGEITTTDAFISTPETGADECDDDEYFQETLEERLPSKVFLSFQSCKLLSFAIRNYFLYLDVVDSLPLFL